MKKTIIFLLLIAAISTSAQTLVKVKSKSVLADSIIMPKYGIEVAPVITDLGGDTTRSVFYSFCQISRDTTSAFICSVSTFDKRGALLSAFNLPVPAASFGRWALFLAKLDTYVLGQRKRLIKQ